jgi:hypothetical protein
MADDPDAMLRNALDAVDRGRRLALFGVVALFIAMAIGLAALMTVAAHAPGSSTDALMLKTLYVATAVQMLFTACCTAAIMFQFTRMTKSILRAIEIAKGK